ncbi:hypothetical protein [Oryzomicrobium sp.]|uniref:hypothetical protein n=1 Tax=Oryzomicrobium sp. TaxID=1911578 RepID=UPI0025DB285F|nr:hypothetical protein [Oryzomicrobium sp.]MCE1241657.1 hypothetical protein [Oryzomicrobium sp.]
MFKRMTATVLVSVGESGGESLEARRVRYAVLKGRRVVREAECEMHELARLGGWQMRASFFSRGAYFERTPSQTDNPRLAAVVARRFIDAEMLFSEAYRLRLQIASAGETDFSLRLAACAEIDCLRIEEGLPLETQPVRLAALEESAIAAVVATATSEPVEVYFARGERFVYFIAEAGEVRQRRLDFLPPDEDGIKDALQRAELALSGGGGWGIGDAAARMPLRIYLGDLKSRSAQADAQRDSASRGLERQLAALVSGGDVLARPELFGLLWVKNRWNMLENAQVQRALAWQVALPASLVLGGASLVLAGLALTHAVENAGLSRQLEGERAQVLRERDVLMGRVPDQAVQARFSEFFGLLQQRNQQVRVDRLLAWVTQELPPGVVIRSISIRPAGGGAVSAESKPLPPNEPPGRVAASGASEHRVQLALTVPGTYESVEAQAGEVLKRLSAKLRFGQSNLKYESGQERALLTSELFARAEDFQ